MRVKRTSKETADWVCNRDGFLKIDKENNEPQIEKTSKRVGYPAYAKVKQDKKANQWYFNHVEEAHNHKLHPFPRMVRYIRTCIFTNKGTQRWMTYLLSWQGMG